MAGFIHQVKTRKGTFEKKEKRKKKEKEKNKRKWKMKIKEKGNKKCVGNLSEDPKGH